MRLAKVYIGGDSAFAIEASHHKRYTNITAQLGYIDTTSATVDEIFNNIEVGLMIFPSGQYELVSYTVLCNTPHRDPWWTRPIKGNKIDDKLFEELYYSIKPGTTLEFSHIRMRKKGTEITMPLPDFWIKAR